jgi:hypothetical protein
METTKDTNSTCQHCGEEVEFGMTQLGYRGFYHVDTKLVACAVETNKVVVK